MPDNDTIEVLEPPVLLDVPAGPGLLARAAVELLGTFALAFVALGAALFLQVFGLDPFSIALATGLTLAALIAAFGHLSGGHFNPAVSLGATMAGRLPLLDLVTYWLAQVIGAVIAATLLLAIVPEQFPAIMGETDARALFGSIANGWGDTSTLAGVDAAFDWRAALVVEVIATIILVAVVLGAAARNAARAAAPFAVGITYGVLLLVTRPVTGGAVNPARATAAALFSDDGFGQLWLFWLAPLAAAAVVGLAYYAFAPLPGEVEEPPPPPPPPAD